MNKTPLFAVGGLIFAAFLSLWLGTGQTRENANEEHAKRGRNRALHLPEVPYRYANVDLPDHFKTRLVQRFDNTPANNPMTDAGAALGRVLFHDARLSANGAVACSSCHQQKHAFADPRRFSKGFEGKEGDRNAMSLVNVRFYPAGRFFWDERAATLEEQVVKPIQSKAEMGQDLDALVELLGKDPVYAELFRKAFGDPKVTSERIARALAQFVRALVSWGSKYDEGLAQAGSVGAAFPNFTPRENRGKTIFLRQCAVCHLPPGQEAVFYMLRPRNNGLDANARVADVGVADVTFNRFQAGQFKSPELRNVEFTAPYMHDGRFATLEEVVTFYSTAVKPHPNLDGALRGPAERRKLTDEDKAALVAFLKTLSDPKFLTDPRFADPFQDK
jgi:cytochrome c peroxidase